MSEEYKFNIGDKVNLVNTGKVYGGYDEWAKAYELTKYESGKAPRRGEFTIVARGSHLSRTQVLYGIENSKNQYIIGEAGLELVEAKEEPVIEETDGTVATVEKIKMSEHEIVGQDGVKNYLKIAIDEKMPVLMVGETGTGKTTLIKEQSIEQGRDIIRFSITGETTVDEFVGKYELEAGRTVWRDGVLLDAMRNGKWLVADEVNAALPEILFVLHSLLDDDKIITVVQHGGEVVKPHENFRFFATMNPTDEYAGTKELNKAFQNRFNMVLEVNYPSPKVEAKIVAGKTGATLEDATKMADVALALRKAKQADKIFYTCSTRDLLHWGRLLKHMNPQQAFIISILNKTGGDKEEVKKIFDHIIKAYLKLDGADYELTIDWFDKARLQLEKERKDFDAHKETMRETITQDIIKSLTTAGVGSSQSKAVEAEVVEEPALDKIFGEI